MGVSHPMAKKKTPTPPRDGGYDWAKIRTEYVTTRTTYRALAEKHGCSLSQLTKRAAREKWTDARQKHRKKRERKAEEKIADRNAEKLARSIEECREQAYELLDRIKQAIRELDEHVIIDTIRTETKMNGETRTETTQQLRTVRSTVQTEDMRRIGATLKDVRDVLAAGERPEDAAETGVLLLPAILPQEVTGIDGTSDLDAAAEASGVSGEAGV